MTENTSNQYGLWEEFASSFDNTTLVICMIIILIAIIGSFVYIQQIKAKDNLINKRRMIELLPQLVSTLGVLGTFLGITLGLMAFNENDLDNSIPQLLGGLKTAFFTSLGGMIGSMILNAYVNKLYDKVEENRPSSTDAALARVCESIEAMSVKNTQVIKALQESMEQQAYKQKQFQETLLGKLGNLDKLSKLDMLNSLDENVSDIVKGEEQMVEFSRESSRTLTHIDNGIGELQDGVNATVTTVEETKEKIEKLANVMATELENIGRMLQESNTKAMVEAMEKAAQTFQEQMQEVVQRLVKENFEQLNTSVQRLNTWQVENKEMIAALTSQYKQMTDKFEATSSVLSQVAQYSQSLSGSAGLLSRLIQELQKVMINDTKYTQIANKLSEAVNLTNTSSQQMHNASNQLNSWMEKQRDFANSVTALIRKLEELSSLRDYNQEFWQSTKRSLEQGVNMVNGTITSLNSQIEDIDQHFYDRLTSTLSNLDRCISEMLRHYGNRRI